ncbi:MAG TPA: efflux RND transporter periplasmic adaptor subunit [Lacipirellulaceae bacterium]|jgi:HlyD family secretion protein|nr:efflux RND transporter periplasmic adaptor subunit [Lacipirellulaceae bacterium]
MRNWITMKRLTIVALLLVAAGASGGLIWWRTHRESEISELVLFGNVDLRQVDLAFNNNERITEVLVQEGDRLRKGQLVAKLDTSRLGPEAAQAVANVALAKANLANARQHAERLQKLWDASAERAVSENDLEAAKAARDAGEAQVKANEEQAALLKQELADTNLFAPSNSIVRSRILEPGDMSSPLKPVLSLSVIDPKWVRTYVSEPDLGKVHPGAKATVEVDSYPNRQFAGWVGFVSPQAEFTPKPVETKELRTSLVYEIRVFVTDPENDLRLGEPATVRLPLGGAIADLSSPAQPEVKDTVLDKPTAAPEPTSTIDGAAGKSP